MSLALPLTVRLKTRRTDVHVETQVKSLAFSSSIPGGFGACSIALDRPLKITPNDFEYFGSLYVYDSRNGDVVWEGRVEDPGKGVSSSGEVWALTAIGGRAHASDRNYQIIYIDTSLDRWVRSQYSTHGAQTDVGEYDENTPMLIVRAEEGTTVNQTSPQWKGDWIYRTLSYTGQKFARLRLTHQEGATSVNYQSGIYLRTGTAAGTFMDLQNWDSTVTVMGTTYGDVGWVDGWNVASIAAIRAGVTTAAGTTVFANFWDVVVRAALKNSDGSDITTPYTQNYVDPAEVVTDLLGRYLTKYDGPNAVVTSTGTNVDQLAYPDGTNAAAIFDDLMVLEPGFYWAAWESNSAGKYRFEWIPWPSTIRYEASTVDGFDSPGSSVELFNACVVRWLDSKGKIRTTRVTQTVAELTDAGLTREEIIDISDEIGSSTNATTVATNFLVEHQYPPNAGTLVVSRPILDQLTGRMVQPWEIRPGHLIRIRGVNPTVDSLNATTRDGVTVFKVLSTSFDSTNVSATLELDTHSRTVARALANMRKRRFRKR